MIENILILDTETTGLDPMKGAQVIEIGAILYSVRYKQIIQTLSTLLACDENPVQDVNNIDAEWTRVNKEELAAIAFLNHMSRQASFIVAHNAQFDKKFMDGLDVGEPFKTKKWVCTKSDFKWPVQLFRNRLQDICEAMGVAYVNAHRALADCTFLASCFSKVPDLQARMERASQSVHFGNNGRFR